ncbi:MAG: arginine--tRNA ligase [Clostridiaceae bacterium]|nr:arginine--tRNA ligase [Clostridiaceae bacterium]
MDFRQEIVKALAARTGLTEDQIDVWLEIPPQSHMGDFAFPCFRLAKTMRKAPPMIAAELADVLEAADYIERTETAGGYLNFFVRRSAYIAGQVKNALTAGSSLGSSDQGEGKTVIVEFSSPNIAKPFHVGHAFTTILGNSLSRIYKHLGYEVIRMNHLGDYGTQFGKLIAAWNLWGDETALEAHPINELLRIYVKFHDEAKNAPELELQARDHFRRLENGESFEKGLWQKFRDLSLKEFNLVYERLGVEFDNFNGESFYSNQIPEVIEELKSKKLLVESEGAQVVMLDEYDLPPCIILKSDGTTIYASRDIAAVLYRDKTYNFHKNIYVVGTPQALHFKQVFSVLEKAGFEKSKDCVHVGFGLVKFPDRKLSTRSGDVILLEDLLNESVDKTYEIIRSNSELRQTDIPEQEMREIAEKIGLAAIMFTFQKNSRERDIVFAWEDMLDFEGDSAPYVLYTYARAHSILRKAVSAGYISSVDELPDDQILDKLVSDDEFALAKLLDTFGNAVERAAAANEPYMLLRQVINLARAFNRYYHNESILKTEEVELRRARLAVLQAVCTAIRTGLELLGIQAVERM